MDFENFLDVVQINELVNHPVRVARDVDKRRAIGWNFVETVNRDNREELIIRPVVGK